MQTASLIYGNCSVLSPDGILMFRCGSKKIDWYLKKGLAEVVSAYPPVIRLNFIPNGLGNHKKGYGLGEMKNICVNCGCGDNLTKHHVVPICYRRWFPEEIKSHNFHDVLPMCVICHENYERKADDVKILLSKKYEAPINGETIKDTSIKYTKMAKTLLSDIAIPRKRRYELKEKIKEKFDIKRLTRKKLKKISEISHGVIKTTHGEMVVSKINTSEFIEMWRKHFIENNDCLYMPKKWNIRYNI